MGKKKGCQRQTWNRLSVKKMPLLVRVSSAFSNSSGGTVISLVLGQLPEQMPSARALGRQYHVNTAAWGQGAAGPALR